MTLMNLTIIFVINRYVRKRKKKNHNNNIATRTSKNTTTDTTTTDGNGDKRDDDDNGYDGKQRYKSLIFEPSGHTTTTMTVTKTTTTSSLTSLTDGLTVHDVYIYCCISSPAVSGVCWESSRVGTASKKVEEKKRKKRSSITTFLSFLNHSLNQISLFFSLSFSLKININKTYL